MAQTQRFEAKYLVESRIADQIRPVIQSILEPDSHSPANPSEGYSILSLYLDNNSRELYRGTGEGLRNRFKLRIRSYRDEPEDPLFFEVKSRVDNVVRKTRATIRRDCLHDLLNGAMPTVEMFFQPDKARIHLLTAFTDRMSRLDAYPCCYVRYRREAYVQPDGRLRVTMDTELHGKAADSISFAMDGPNWFPAELEGADDPVILEIKFNDVFPGWIRDLVREFNLKRISVPKYLLCADATGVAPFYNALPGRIIR